MEAKDYDGRTALHVATSEGHLEIVEYLLKNCQVNPLPKVRAVGMGFSCPEEAHFIFFFFFFAINFFVGGMGKGEGVG